MGVITVSKSISINRPKVYVLKMKYDYSHPQYDLFKKDDNTIGYFTSKENASAYVKELVDKGRFTRVISNDIKRKDGKVVYRFVQLDRYHNIVGIVKFLIEEHEMDLCVDEISYYGTDYPDDSIFDES